MLGLDGSLERFYFYDNQRFHSNVKQSLRKTVFPNYLSIWGNLRKANKVVRDPCYCASIPHMSFLTSDLNIFKVAFKYYANSKSHKLLCKKNIILNSIFH